VFELTPKVSKSHKQSDAKQYKCHDNQALEPVKSGQARGVIVRH